MIYILNLLEFFVFLSINTKHDENHIVQEYKSLYICLVKKC